MPDRLTRREVDARVAEVVFGHAVGVLEIVPGDLDDDSIYYLNTATGGTKSGLAYRAGDLMEGDGHLTKYTEDIAAAMQIVEKMVGDGWEWSTEVRKGHTHATFWNQTTHGLSYYRDGHKLQACICLAALAAHGIDVELAEEK